MAAIDSVVSFGGVTYCAPNVYVAFVGIRGKETMVQTIADPSIPPIRIQSDTTVTSLVTQAACDRFMITGEEVINPTGLNLEAAMVYRSTALTIAPQIKIMDPTAPVVIEPYDPTDPVPMKPLYLIAYMKIELLAPMRARAAYKTFVALKMEASVAGVIVNDTKFAGICGLESGAFSKAMSCVSSAPTALDGNTVMKLESRITAYRADLPTLKRDLENAIAAKDLTKEDVPMPPPTAPAPAPAAAGDAEPAAPVAKSKPICDKGGMAFLMPFMPKWIADEKNRPGRVATMAAILEAVKTESTTNTAGWDVKYLEAKMKKLAAKWRKATV